jgi:hypothetical protein
MCTQLPLEQRSQTPQSVSRLPEAPTIPCPGIPSTSRKHRRKATGRGGGAASASVRAKPWPSRAWISIPVHRRGDPQDEQAVKGGASPESLTWLGHGSCCHDSLDDVLELIDSGLVKLASVGAIGQRLCELDQSNAQWYYVDFPGEACEECEVDCEEPPPTCFDSCRSRESAPSIFECLRSCQSGDPAEGRETDRITRPSLLEGLQAIRPHNVAAFPLG